MDFDVKKTITTDTDIIAIDLGYSSNKKSCGIKSKDFGPKSKKFGGCISKTKELIKTQNNLSDFALVLEAPLSTSHDEEGNPEHRGEFERRGDNTGDRGWYYGAGVLTFAAALRFLNQLKESLGSQYKIGLKEAFLTNKSESTSHKKDAELIFNNIRSKKPLRKEDLKNGLEPIAPLQNVPEIYVFESDS